MTDQQFQTSSSSQLFSCMEAGVSWAAPGSTEEGHLLDASDLLGQGRLTVMRKVLTPA